MQIYKLRESFIILFVNRVFWLAETLYVIVIKKQSTDVKKQINFLPTRTQFSKIESIKKPSSDILPDDGYLYDFKLLFRKFIS
jgi:hypothetical protein